MDLIGVAFLLLVAFTAGFLTRANIRSGDAPQLDSSVVIPEQTSSLDLSEAIRREIKR
jgi:hypothetical protein